MVTFTNKFFTDSFRWSWLLLLLMGCGTGGPEATPVAMKSEPVPAANTLVAEQKLEVGFLSWNLESEGSDPAVICQQLADMKRYDIYALSEVLPAASETLEAALGTNYTFTTRPSLRRSNTLKFVRSIFKIVIELPWLCI